MHNISLIKYKISPSLRTVSGTVIITYLAVRNWPNWFFTQVCPSDFDSTCFPILSMPFSPAKKEHLKNENYSLFERRVEKDGEVLSLVFFLHFKKIYKSRQESNLRIGIPCPDVLQFSYKDPKFIYDTWPRLFKAGLR